MMKKILLLSTIIALGFSSCDPDDETPVSKGYVTDGLPLPQEKNVLLMMGTSIENPTTGGSEAIRLIYDDEYKGRINTFNLVSSNMGGFYDSYADSIMMNFQSPISPFFVVNDMEVLPTELPAALKAATKGKPALAISHKVSENDTAWVVNNKVKFFVDTIYDEFYIDTYMLAKLKAQVYNEGEITEISFRIPNSKDLITNPDEPLVSVWDSDIPSLDSSKVLVKKGSHFYHQNMFVDKFDSTSTWGPKLGSYWPFGGEFYSGDVIGTKDTPIKHYFRKNENLTQLFGSYEIKFLSVVWVKDPISGSMEHVNSYTTSSTTTVR